MKLREIKFNNISHNGYIGLCIRDGDLVLGEGFIGEVLTSIPNLADREVLKQHGYFDIWVINLKPIEKGETK